MMLLRYDFESDPSQYVVAPSIEAVTREITWFHPAKSIHILDDGKKLTIMEEAQHG